MKLLLKILFAPFFAAMWLTVKISSAVIYLSGLVLGAISGIIVVIGLVYILTGSVSNGIIGLVIAYLLSPYGIPMLVIILLGTVQRIRESLKYMLSR